ncbi:MAG: PQQ-dependent sugar dehydrogenase [Bacteroidetes bacterium]|nr:PQQ-dependent sugar dehydrogenase [Bacteroidota bacterium]
MNTLNTFSRFAVIVTLLISTLYAQNGVELVTFTTGLNNPIEITNAGDSRLFVVEQAGLIRILEPDGSMLSVPFLDITDRVKSGGEQGLLGLAFHPDYAINGHFYVNYTDDDDNTNIARFTVSSNPNLADVSSEITLLIVDQPFQNHNGGDLAFGGDGYLYIGLGDGGSGGDPGNRAQDLGSYLGKMLRIDVDNGDPYAIPSDNPFVNNPNALDEIWAYGLRNPWRFSFDRETDDMWIGDVGQNQMEEIDRQPSLSTGGENYGWRCYEGSIPYNTNGCGPQSDYVFPVFEYSHDQGCSVTGGFVYRGSEIPQMHGYYFFTDYCTDDIWTLHQEGSEWVHELFGTYAGNNFSTFGEDVNGELYIAGIGSGKVFKFEDTSSGTNNFPSVKLKIYPNPFKDKIRISANLPISAPGQITITTLQGNIVYHANDFKDKDLVDLGFLSAGTYILIVKSDRTHYIKKVSKL